MSETKLTAALLAKYEVEVAGNERVGFTASRVDNADLLSLIAAARELEARWIPVAERQPERGESNLLFLSRTSTVRQGFRTSGVLYFLDDGDPATGVTHWMPLPKGPTK